jgi:hypothetical protein
LSVLPGPHASTSDRLSVHWNVTSTASFFQPAVLAAGDAEPPIVGLVASRLILTSTGPAEPPALVAEQL